ncbi:MULTISPECIES: 5-formyltetrahydrofolate cyclo-ligase [Subtercola]|uniref:5-formyltetrahydrofolate cyclo-ligase n=1 Tax=Subtercola vilae TaxID=2056433 RepID=A0A4V4RER6_9MICO|nr:MULTISPECIES: 5-formyltetrahydrofolate cyclo-ligase [Subtercola]MEA9986356.1 5-formyltetrahydrofolate cyclo-ligase [Subtercola sp. RTI3]TIH35004.1 5-formyltetrahydrofolate cyclo-ligase [Subtercola vilae]
MQPIVSNLKRALRAELRERRRTRTSTERAEATEAFTQNLIALTLENKATFVACYLSAPNEPNTRPYLNWAFENGVRTLFPITREDGLLDWAHGDGESEVEGLFGTPEPVGELLGPIAINDVDLIIVPAAAIDVTGMRMGWGRGYFDKTLGSMKKCPPVYAVIYDDELIDAVPREVHDQPVNGIVTPTRILSF